MSQAQEAGTQQRILLIVADNSLRRLITLGLQYRGMRTIEASSPSALPADEIETQPPALLVLDVDSGVSSDWELLESVQEHHYLSTLPIVVLAWECPLPAEIAVEQHGQITCLAKPFDARTLHARIEQLLAERAEKAALALAEAESVQQAAQQQEEEASTVSPSSASSPAAPVPAGRAQVAYPTASIWPFITAFGLLLAFIGLMVQITLTGLGILIVLVGLLLWTLGTKPQQPTVPITNRLTPVSNGKAT
jgi:FixJ family two-component response regulator